MLPHALYNKCVHILRICAVLVMAALFGAQNSAADDLEKALGDIWAEIPRPGELLVYPDLTAWNIYGADGAVKTVTSPGAHNNKARSITVKKAGQNPWDIGAQTPNQLPIKSGDLILAQVWLRAAKLPRGQTTASLPLLLQETSAPYANFAQETITVGKNWQSAYIYGRVDKNFAVEKFAVSLQLAGAKQTIELGSVFLLNLGSAPADLSNLSNDAAVAAAPMQSPANTKAAQSQGALPSTLQADFSALQARLPKQGVLISNPSVDHWATQGDNHAAQIVSAADVPGNQAKRVETKKAGQSQWDVAALLPVTGVINKGDAILLAFYARAVEVHNEAQTGIISTAKIELSREPYTSIQDGAAKLPKTWELYYIPGKASRAYAVGDAQVSLHLGAVKQTLELGPAYVINLGQNVDLNALPSNRVSYEGRSLDAPWRAQAKARIDQHRKGNLAITVQDEAGAPIVGADIRVEMTRHDFPFGTFTNYNYGTNRAADFPKVGQTIEQHFNAVTMPLYWADWGWENPQMSAEFKRGVEFVAAKGTPWRAHPAVWPGESKLPSRILNMKPGSKAQRKAVLAHVKDVMSFIKPHNPIAIDLINEPRTNHYFEDHGDAELVPDIYRLAHEIAPDIPLFINDYSILNGSGHNQGSIDFYHQWIKKMQRKKVPVGGIGFQAHFSAGLTPPARVYELLEEFSVYGLPLHITEFDVDTRDEQAKADYTRDFLTIAFSHPSVEAFIVWGFWEGDHWKADAAMVARDWSDKLSFTAWKKTIYEEFWTRGSARTNASGQASIRGFYGEYDVTTTIDGVSKTQSVRLDKDGAPIIITR